MAINLTKGQTINLDKEQNDLTTMTIGLGWKIKKKPAGFFKKMLSGGDKDEYDLDAVAFLLNASGKIQNLGGEQLSGSDVIFYKNLRHPSGAVTHSGDNLVGGSGNKDDEQIVVKLNSIPANYDKILFLVTIYQGNQKKQHFGDVEGAFMRAVDARGNEIARYELGDGAAYVNMCTLVFGEVYRKDAGWKFRAIGDALPTDSFVHVLQDYVVQR